MISDPLAARIRQAAQQEQLAPEEILMLWLERYTPTPSPASSLTDADIDHESIPHLKSEKGQVQLPNDPMNAILGMFDSELI